YYGIAIVKNTAPESPKPHSTSMICPMIMPPLNHMICIGLTNC
ncbi:hypothetical protein ACN38_g1551, partial [Penicillium nordicum]